VNVLAQGLSLGKKQRHKSCASRKYRGQRKPFEPAQQRRRALASVWAEGTVASLGGRGNQANCLSLTGTKLMIISAFGIFVEQVHHFHTKSLRKCVQRQECRIGSPIFELADGLLGQAGDLRKCLLRPVLFAPELLHISPQQLAQIHAARLAGYGNRFLSCIICKQQPDHHG
jgi:hypothetical protein